MDKITCSKIEDGNLIDVPDWIEKNKEQFVPPICLKMMHNDGQMKLFFIGGPNQRNDYHIEEGEELFYMIKGDMCLKVVEKSVHKDVIIRQGEIFLLPANVFHSPQRRANTVGLVIERERLETEFDGLKYFTSKDGKPTLEALYERYVHCKDIASDLGPIIKDFFKSDEYKTGIPSSENVVANPPILYDDKVSLEPPFSLSEWINNNREQVKATGQCNLFPNGKQFLVEILGEGESEFCQSEAETWIWVLEGTAHVDLTGRPIEMKHEQSLLIPSNKKCLIKRSEGCIILKCHQNNK